MKNKRQLIPIVGLLSVMAIVAYVVVQMNAQAPAATGDFTNAAIAEVKDAQGQVVLRGEFVPADEDDDDIERKAALVPTGLDPDAKGEAEVEFAKAAPAEQEIEFSVQNLQPGTAFTFVIDGKDVGSATADKDGRAEVELEVKLPGKTAPR